MRVLVTGAAGFVGQLLAHRLLNDEDGRYSLILTDVIEPPIPKNVRWPGNAKVIAADLSCKSSKVVDHALDAVFIFHGIMSSGAEFNFDLGMSLSALPSPKRHLGRCSFADNLDRHENQL